MWGVQTVRDWWKRRAATKARQKREAEVQDREFCIGNLLLRIHFIVVMIRWTGLAPWELEFPFPGSLTSNCDALAVLQCAVDVGRCVSGFGLSV